MELHSLIERQRSCFDSGVTRPVKFRLEMLRRLQAGIRAREAEIADALRSDLNKPAFEAYMTETGMALGRDGSEVCKAQVVSCRTSPAFDRTALLTIRVPQDMCMKARFFRREEDK